MIDTQYIIIKYGSELDKYKLSVFGQVSTDLELMSMLFLKRHPSYPEDKIISDLLCLKGILSAEFNEIRDAHKSFSSIWTGSMGEFNSYIYQELNMETAWAITKGDPRIKIAVLDSGVDSRHPNLKTESGGIFLKGAYVTSQTFPMKIVPDQLCGDSPVSGYFQVIEIYQPTDDRYVSLGTTPVTAYSDPTCTEPLFTGQCPIGLLQSVSPLAEFWINEPIDMYVEYETSPESSDYKWTLGIGLDAMRDLYAHGTFCAGIINGQHDGKGVPGIAPDCTLTAYKVYSDEARFNTLDLIASIYAAVNDGNHVISYSISSDRATAGELAAFDYALDNNVVFVAAAGNAGHNPTTDVAIDIPLYPACYSDVISVGACGDRLSQTSAGGWIDSEPSLMDYSRISYFSTKTNTVFILAPGDGWRAHSPLNNSYMWQQFSRTEQFIKGYSCQSESGTSFATPATAGGVGLMLSKALIGQNTQDPAEVKAILASAIPLSRVRSLIASTANPTVKLSNGNPATVGYGNGRLNIGAAVTAV